MIVFVGSTRPAKVEAAREALAAIASVDSRFALTSLHAHEVTDIAPRMPMNLGEIIDGARARATAVWAPPVGTFAVGLEGGLVQLPRGHWSLQSWAAVTDGVSWGYGAGPSLVLPDAVARRVVGGEELGDVIDQLAAAPVRGTRGAWGMLTLDLIGRRDAFRAAMIATFAPFYNRAAWTSGDGHELGLDPRPY